MLLCVDDVFRVRYEHLQVLQKRKNGGLGQQFMPTTWSIDLRLSSLKTSLCSLQIHLSDGQLTGSLHNTNDNCYKHCRKIYGLKNHKTKTKRYSYQSQRKDRNSKIEEEFNTSVCKLNGDKKWHLNFLYFYSTTANYLHK